MATDEEWERDTGIPADGAITIRVIRSAAYGYPHGSPTGWEPTMADGLLGWVFETTGTAEHTLQLYAPDPGVSWGRTDWGWAVFRWTRFRDGWGWLSAAAGAAATEAEARAAGQDALRRLEAADRG